MSATNAMVDRFTAEAAAWDSNPITVRSSELAYGALRKYVPTLHTRKLDVLEIGCGTGLLSFHLAPHVHTLVGVDLAQGMIDAFQAKVAHGRAFNVTALNHLLEDPDAPQVQQAAKQLLRSVDGTEVDGPIRWDLVVSHLTLHHIPVLKDILRTCYQSLKPGGRIALTDFQDTGPDSIHFHPASKRADVERHGIKKDEILDEIRQAGFVGASVEVAFSSEKDVDPQEAGGRTKMDFPFLICLGEKPNA